MAPLYVEVIDVEPHVEEKLAAKHGVEFSEVEDVLFDDAHRVERTREGLYLVLGQTSNGRYLAIVVAPKGEGVWAVVTARDMTDTERRRLRRK